EALGHHSNGHAKFELDDYLFLATILKTHFATEDITLSGGDPFLFKDIGSLGKGIHNLGINVTAISKGRLVYDRIFNGDLEGNEFDWVYFSFDTLDPTKFAKIVRVESAAADLEKAITVMKLLILKGVKVKINCVVHPDTLRDQSDIL